MFNVLFAFVLFFQTADPFATLEKMLAKHQPVLVERDAAFAQLKASVKSGVELNVAYLRYLKASDAALKSWLDLSAELNRTKKLAGDKPDQKTKDRLTRLTARVDAYNPPRDQEAVMKAYLEKLGDPAFGPQAPVIPKPKQR